MRWKVHGRRTMYESDWVNVYLDDVELPDGTHIDHHVLTMPKASQTAIVLNRTEDAILLIWRHRFITDKWGWEVPAGWVEPGEKPEDSIKREILEETGYLARNAHELAHYDALPGLSTMAFRVWITDEVELQGKPDGLETSQVQWHKTSYIADLLRKGQVSDGPSFTALSYFLSTNRQ